MSEIDDTFNELVNSRLGFLVGSEEIEGRLRYGDETYDKIMFFTDQGHMMDLRTGAANVNYTLSRAALRRSLTAAMYLSCLLASGWSTYYWFH